MVNKVSNRENTRNKYCTVVGIKARGNIANSCSHVSKWSLSVKLRVKLVQSKDNAASAT